MTVKSIKKNAAWNPDSSTKRHLIYHVCPLKKNEHWRDNLVKLRMRWNIFSGRKVVAIACGEGMHAPDVVRDAFHNDESIQFLEIQNDTRLREVATFLPLLSCVSAVPQSDAIFYAHTKGNSTADSVEGSVLWRNVMYERLLDWEIVKAAFKSRPNLQAVGTHKMMWPHDRQSPYPTHLDVGNWMFAGTFFWFRASLFQRPGWRNVADDRYGAEAWLSSFVGWHESVSVFQPWAIDHYPSPSPYDPKLYRDNST